MKHGSWVKPGMMDGPMNKDIEHAMWVKLCIINESVSKGMKH